MKKILVLLSILILVTGCTKEQKKEEVLPVEEEETPVEEVVPEYEDLNQTPISFYRLNGNTLTKLTTISGHFGELEDIGIFQVYPSNEESLSFPNGFPSSYHEEWMKYQNEYSVKVGFSISFTLKNGEEVFYNIFTPNNTMDKWEYLLTYLYDDYHNMGKSFYSHIEPEEYTDETLFTAIKIQLSGYYQEINSPITLSVFTYQDDDDFLDGHYRGNSQSQLTICINDIC